MSSPLEKQRTELSSSAPARRCEGLALSSELSIAAPLAAAKRRLAKVEFEFELDFVVVGAYFPAKVSTNAPKLNGIVRAHILLNASREFHWAQAHHRPVRYRGPNARREPAIVHQRAVVAVLVAQHQLAAFELERGMDR